MAVDEVFRELRAKGLVKKATECRSAAVLNFKAGGILRNRIFYNQKYANLDANLLRFALLHEEGHLRTKQYSQLVFNMDYLLMAPYIGMVLWSGSFKDNALIPVIIVALPFELMLIPFSLRIFGDAIQEDEDSSDMFAARTLKDAYAIRNPSMIAMQLFRSLASENPDSFFHSILFLFGGGMHPKNEERVKRIKEIVDDTP
jgi:hypothetical protein